MISSKAVGSMTLVIIIVAGIHVFAEDQSAAELYGQGVHAYFAGDYESAVGLLSSSIEINGLDPRPYYFRGLALANQHGLDSGLPDIAKGAEIEASKMDQKIYDVNGALQRVQGTLRLALEKQRSAARVAAAERKKRQDRVRYEELKRREDVVVFDPNRPLKKVDLELPKVDLGGEDPFSSGVAFTGGKEVAQVAPTPVEPSAAEVAEPAADTEAPRDPFAAPEEQPAMQPEDPFGASPAGAKAPPAEKPKAGAEPDAANPFGDAKPEVSPDDSSIFDPDVRPQLPPSMNVGGTVMDLLGKTLSGSAANRDPFGDSKAEAPPKKEAEPPAEEPTADPLGDSGAAKKEPAADTPAEKQPAEPSADPFK